MDLKETVKRIVQKIVEEYMNQQSQNQSRKPITILLGNQTPNSTAVLKAITHLLQTYDVKLLLTKD